MEEHEDLPELPKSMDQNFRFYDLFYETAPQSDGEAAIMQLCMIAISPAVGPESGGTAVTLQLAGQVHPGHTTFFCKFGEEVVRAVGPGAASHFSLLLLLILILLLLLPRRCCPPRHRHANGPLFF